MSALDSQEQCKADRRDIDMEEEPHERPDEAPLSMRVR
jgi:hypothetical protein